MKSKKKSHLIHIDHTEKEKIERYKYQIKHPEFTDEPKKFCLVEKLWYLAFLDWLQKSVLPSPGEIRTKNLLKDKHFNPELIYHQDYEVIALEIFEELTKVFECNQRVVRYFRNHPETRKPTILHKPFYLKIFYEQNNETLKIVEAVDPSWQLRIMTTYLSKKLNIQNNDITFLSPDSETLNQSITCYEIKEKYKGRIFILNEQPLKQKLFDTISNKYTGFNVSTNTNNLPIPQSKSQPKSYNGDSNSSSYEDVNTTPPIFSRPESKKTIKPVILNEQVSTKSSENRNSLLDQTKTGLRSRSSSPFPKPIGLMNLGNTCFFNAAVQCLIRCTPLTDFILSSQCQSQINTKNPLGTKGRIAMAYRELLQEMTKSSSASSKTDYYPSYFSSTRYAPRSGSLNPSRLHGAIAHQYPIFESFGQNDSQELVGCLLDGLHEDLNQAHSAKGYLSPVRVSKDPDSWETYMSKNSSPVMDIFTGKLFRSIKCPKCHHEKLIHDPFMFLSLPIPSTTTSVLSRYTGFSRSSYSKVKLSECYDCFTKSEMLDGSNLWKCDKCKQQVKATVKIGVTKASDILIIHLKRFDGQSYYMKKIETPVEYPDVLEPSFFKDSNSEMATNGNNSIGKYRLIGVVFHHGYLSGGHYTSAAMDPETEKWYEFNDSCVSPINGSEAHSGKAYILFYQKF